MSSIIFDSFTSLYNYYYQIGKDWTSLRQATPEKGYVCLLKIQRHFDEFECIKGSFTDVGWIDIKGAKIEAKYSISENEFAGGVIEWKYDSSAKSSCSIL